MLCGLFLAAMPRLFGITLTVMRIFAAILCCGGIQPERLNAEGEARVLVAGGGASAQPPEYRHHQEKRLEDAKAAAKASDIRVLRIMWGGMIPRVTLRSTLG